MLIFTCVLTYINNRFLFFISLELTTDLVAAYKNHSYERNKFLYIKKKKFYKKQRKLRFWVQLWDIIKVKNLGYTIQHSQNITPVHRKDLAIQESQMMKRNRFSYDLKWRYVPNVEMIIMCQWSPSWWRKNWKKGGRW